MRHSGNAVLPGNFSFDRGSPINLVIGYEDFVTGQRAIKSCEHLIDRLSRDFQFLTALWKFDILRVPQLTEIAAEDIAEADMVVISAHGSGELPGQVKNWIEGLPRKKRGGARALVALLDDGDGHKAEESPVHCYLQEFARRASLDYFSRQCVASGGGAPSVEFSSSVLQSSMNMSDWGINE